MSIRVGSFPEAQTNLNNSASCQIYSTNLDTIPSGILTQITFNQTQFTSNPQMVDLTNNRIKITIPGFYVINSYINTNFGATAVFQNRNISVNGVAVKSYANSLTEWTADTVIHYIKLNSGDYVEVFVLQNSGVNREYGHLTLRSFQNELSVQLMHS